MDQPWNAPEREVTPEPVVVSRRKWLKWAGWTAAGLVAAGAGGGLWWWSRRGTDAQVLAAGMTRSAPGLFPARRNPQFADADRPETEESAASRYCNFYEFSSDKYVWRVVDGFQTEPWTVRVDGLVRQPRTFDIDTLCRTFPLEERIYRHRCVEAWAMVVPWTGFPLAALLRHVDPLPEARFVKFVSFDRPEEAPRMHNRNQPWPYTEGLTLAEANNELAFVATGMYGHALRKQHGAPVRLVVPWKYGFKSAKSIVHIELTDQQPATFWNTLVPREYDFQANVNPRIPHPRWSQENERMLGTNERFPTQLYNGYGTWVADLYR
jgi:sulfoxide reductase catalytic subunit YedY